MENARNTVAAITDNPAAAVEYKTSVVTNSGDYYVFDSNKDISYVNTRNGNIERIDYYSEHPEKSLTVSVSSDKARSIAESYAVAHYQNFTKTNMQLVTSDLVDHHIAKEYLFIWKQTIQGIDTPNRVIVSVDPASGKVLSYMGISLDITVPLNPVVTKEAALKIAGKQFPSVVPVKTEATLSVDYPVKDEQKLIWVVEIQGNPSDGIMQGGFVAVDAVSGEVLLTSPYA